MKWFKKDPKSEIPALTSEISPKNANDRSYTPPPSYTTTQTTDDTGHVSRQRDFYGSDSRGGLVAAQSSVSYRTPTERSIDNKHNADAERAALFGPAASADGPHRNRFPAGGTPKDVVAEEDEEDVEAIKSKIKEDKIDTVQTTRNALQLARDTEAMATATLEQLGRQSDKLANTERRLDVAKNYSNEAKTQTTELKKLNSSIFNPVGMFASKSKQRKKQAEEAERRHQDDIADRERIKRDGQETGRRLNARPNSQVTDDSGKTRNSDRKRFQFEATASDDEMEDEIENNLDEISDLAGRLNHVAMTMGQELGAQNTRLDRMDEKAGRLDVKIQGNVSALKRIH